MLKSEAPLSEEARYFYQKGAPCFDAVLTFLVGGISSAHVCFADPF
jgi:hypothetical protein